MSSLLAMCESMRLSATGRLTSEFAATARWTCAMPPIPSCSYTMYGPNRSVGEPSLTRTSYQFFSPLAGGIPPAGASRGAANHYTSRRWSGRPVPPIERPGGRRDHAVDQCQRRDRQHELDRGREYADGGPHHGVVARSEER